MMPPTGIKSDYTYDRIDMNDRLDAYRKLG